MSARRRIALAYVDTQTPCEVDEQSEDEFFAPFAYGVHRVMAAAREAFPEDDVRLFRGEPGGAEALYAQVAAFDPELFGASCFIWSLATLLEVAQRLKARRPELSVILGGPCAHPIMFEMPVYAPGARAVDALVTREGEEAFVNILALERRDAASLRTVPGIQVRHALGFRATEARRELKALDELPSPLRMGLTPPGSTPHLETYRGCPLSCAFCEWGVGEEGSRVTSVEWLTAEFEECKRLGARALFCVDAGINLNSRAFHNLVEAERRVQLLRDIPYSFHAYPDYVRREHVEFLSRIKVHHCALGLQSTNQAALAGMHRKYNPRKFRESLAMLLDVAEVAIELIVGLPGDDPESFLRCVDEVRGLDPRANVVVYRCLALPDGLLTRGPAPAEVTYDPYTFEVRSCPGWSEQDFVRIERELGELARGAGGRVGEQWFQFPPQRANPLPGRERYDSAASLQRRAPTLDLAPLSAHITAQSAGRWSLEGGEASEQGLQLAVLVEGQRVVLDVHLHTPQRRGFRAAHGLLWSYRGEGTERLAGFLPTLTAVLEHAQAVAPALRAALGGDTAQSLPQA